MKPCCYLILLLLGTTSYLLHRSDEAQVSLCMRSPHYLVVHCGIATKVLCDIHKTVPRIDSNINRDAYIFTSQNFPDNPNFLPTVGNGHIATRIHGDFIYMNNFYNGYTVHSHRAGIPSTVNVNITGVEPPSSFTRNLTLNTAEGIYTETLFNENFTLHHRTYAHRDHRLKRLLVMEIDITLHAPVTAVKLSVQTTPTKDLDIQQSNVNQTLSYTVSTIRTPETNSSDRSQVFIYHDNVPSELKPNPGSKRVKWVFLTSVSTTAEDALSTYDEGRKFATSNDQLYANHVTSWTEIWRGGRIDVTGNLPLARASYGSLYYLMSSLPTQHDNLNPYTGISPGGLAHGDLLKDYQGHVFWDQETWMYPPILTFHSAVAKLMLAGRVRRLAAARENAAKNNYKGAQFPWESAFTGAETSPSAETARFELHISGDIALAVRQYLHTTRDSGFVDREGGGQMLAEVADFWAGRLTADTHTGQLGINDVMGPDEDHFPVNNSVYTNAVAKIALNAPSEAYALLNKSSRPEYRQLADKISIPFDVKNQYHPEFDGYTLGTTVKQADVVLLGYPLLLSMNRTVRSNDLLAYENVTRADGPAMTWSMFAIGWLELQDYKKAETLFQKNFQYIQGPFQIWSEEVGGTGAFNFVTGMGGFLQSIINGYAGMRVLSDRLNFDPVLPPQSTALRLVGVDYLGSSFDVDIRTSYVDLQLTGREAERPSLVVHVYSSRKTILLELMKTIRLPREKFAVTISESFGSM